MRIFLLDNSKDNGLAIASSDALLIIYGICPFEKIFVKIDEKNTTDAPSLEFVFFDKCLTISRADEVFILKTFSFVS